MATPSRGSRLAEIIFAGTRSGSPLPVIVMLVGRNAPIAENDCARARQSS